MSYAFRKRTVEGLIDDTDHVIGIVALGHKYSKVHGIRARNWASLAKRNTPAGDGSDAGTDAAIKIKLTDNNGDVFYLDASDRDYKTAEITLAIGLDDTASGLGITPVDSTGAAATAGAGIVPVVESPVTVTILNGATATDYMVVELLVEG